MTRPAPIVVRMARERDVPRTRIGRYLNALMEHHGHESFADIERAIPGPDGKPLVSASMMSKWFSGQSRPSVDSLRAILPAFPGTRLVDLILEAELMTSEELGLASAAPVPPAQHKLAARINRYLLDVNYPEAARARVESSLEHIFEALAGGGTPLPKEPSAAERAAGRTVTR